MRFFKSLFSIGAIVSCILIAIYYVAIPVVSTIVMPDEVRLTRGEIAKQQTVTQNQFVQTSYDDSPVDDGGKQKIKLKLFGLFPIKTVMVDVLPYDELYAGGLPIGMIAKTDGVVITKSGNGYKRGEVITSIDGATVTSVEDMKRHLVGRKVGVYGKDDTSGVGTLTYINPKDNNFAALGHKLVDYETGASVNIRSGDVYCCNVLGVDKSHGRRVGTMESTLRKSGGIQGSVTSSNNYGVFGCLHGESEIVIACKDNLFPVASRYSVKQGKASILFAYDGTNIQEYDIDILKTRQQRDKGSKGMVLKITDPRLLEKTGGIVQGMSGAPIIQNGHIIGAVTHVMAGDCTKGYGIYIDFLVP